MARPDRPGLPVFRTIGAVLATIALLVALWALFGEDRPMEEAVDRDAPGVPEPRPPPPLEERPAPPPAAPPVATEPEIRPFERRIAERLAADRVDATPIEEPIRVLASAVAWDDPEGRPLLRADTIVARLRLAAAVGGDVVFDELTLVAPALFLEGDPGPPERWNYEAVLAQLLDEEDAAAAPDPRDIGLRVTIRDAVIRDGRLAVRPPGPEGPYFARDIDASIPLAVFGPEAPEGPIVRVARLEATLAAPDLEEPTRVTVIDAALRFPDGVLAFDIARVAAAEAVVTGAVGTFTFDAPGLGLRLDASVTDLPLARLQPLVPQLPDEGTASFALEVEPLPAGRTAIRFLDLAARARDSNVFGSLALAVGGDAPTVIASIDLRLDPLSIALLERVTGPLPYTGFVRGTVAGTGEALAFDVTARLRSPEVEGPIVADLTGTLALTPEGAQLERLTADLRDVPAAALQRFAPVALPPGALITGRVEVDGVPREAPLALDVDVTLDGGVVQVAGTLDVTGPVPRYDLSGRLVEVPVSALVEPAVPPVALTARFAVVGRGQEPAALDARLFLEGEFTGWRAEPGDGILVEAAVDEGVLALDTAAVRLATLDLDAAGTWRFLAPARGGIDYRLAVDSLAPFAPYLPLPPDGPVSGRIATRGELGGTLEVPRLAGTAEAEELRYGEWFFGTAEAVYETALPPRRGLRLDAVAERARVPELGAFQRLTLEATIDDPMFAVDLRGTRPSPAQGDLVLVADGRFLPGGVRVATVRELQFDLDGSPWTLVEPATVRWTEERESILVRDLRLRQVDGEGVLALDGRVPPANGVGLDFEAAALPVGELIALTGRRPRVAGEVWAEGELRGTLASPLLEAEFRILQPRFDQVELAVFEGDVAYGERRLRLDVFVRADTLLPDGGTLDMDADIPFVLSFADGVEARLADAGPLRGEATADRFPVAVFDPLLLDVRDPEGWVSGRVRAAGSVAEPRLDGQATLVQGAATIVPLDQRYEEITADVAFEGARAVIRELRARSDGWATASGTVAFADIDEPTIDVRFTFAGFRPVGVDDYDDAAVDGQLRAAGPLDAPIVTGDVTVDDGTLPIAGFEGDGLDPAFDEEAFAELEAELIEEPEEPSWIDRIVLDAVAVRAGDDLWFSSEQARIQLAGDLTLVRTEPDALQIFGSLQGERGTITLIAGPIVRQLDVVEAEVRFFGSIDISPAIDITASQTVFGPDGEPFDVLVRIGGTFDEPTLALEAPNGAPIPESELVSLLIFGQPAYAVDPGDVPAQAVFEDVFFGGLAGLAAIELEQALVGEFGLPFDYVRIRPVAGEYGGLLGAPAIVFGTEIADDLFLTVDTGIATLFGSTDAGATWGASLQWRVDPEWTVELGIEPVFRGVFFPVAGFISPGIGAEQQFFVDVRRRWTY